MGVKTRAASCVAVTCAALGLLVMGAQMAPAQTAGGVFYECDMTPTKRNKFWISSKIGIVLLNDGSAVITDGVILNYQQSTVEAVRLGQTDSRIRLDWRLDGRLLKAGEREVLLPAAEYRAVISKPSNRIRVTGKLRGYRGNFSGRGQCALRLK